MIISFAELVAFLFVWGACARAGERVCVGGDGVGWGFGYGTCVYCCCCVLFSCVFLDRGERKGAGVDSVVWCTVVFFYVTQVVCQCEGIISM